MPTQSIPIATPGTGLGELSRLARLHACCPHGAGRSRCCLHGCTGAGRRGARTGVSWSPPYAPSAAARFNWYLFIVFNCNCESNSMLGSVSLPSKPWSLRVVLGTPRHKHSFIESVDSYGAPPGPLPSLPRSTYSLQTSQPPAQKWPGLYRGHLSPPIHLPARKIPGTPPVQPCDTTPGNIPGAR